MTNPNPIFDRLPLRPDAIIDGIAVEYHNEIIHPRFLDARSARYAAAGMPVRFEFSGMGDNPVTRAWQDLRTKNRPNGAASHCTAKFKRRILLCSR
jgi:hypothetical protein